MKDREDAARAAKKAAALERNQTETAFTNMNTPLDNKYTERRREYESDKAKQGMQNLQNRVYESERNRRA
jgi:hypothetical protein